MHRYSTKGSIELPLHVIDKGLRISHPTGNIILGGSKAHWRALCFEYKYSHGRNLYQER